MVVVALFICSRRPILALLLFDLPHPFFFHQAAELGQPLDDVGQSISDQVGQGGRVRIDNGCETEDESAQLEFVNERRDEDEEAVEDWEGPPISLQNAEGESRVVPEGHAHHLECHRLEVLCHLGFK